MNLLTSSRLTPGRNLGISLDSNIAVVVTDSNKLQSFQRKFSALHHMYKRFFKNHKSWSYNFVLENLKLLTSFERWCYFYIDFQLDTLRGFSIFSASFSSNNYPFLRCVLAANEICNNVNMFDNYFSNINLQVNLVNRFLQYFVTLSVIIRRCLACIYCAVEYLV
jgi:hypothetical protein